MTPLHITDHLQNIMCHDFSDEAICLSDVAKPHTYNQWKRTGPFGLCREQAALRPVRKAYSC